MHRDPSSHPTRREAVKLGLLASAGLALGRWSPLAAAAPGAQAALIRRPIPSSGESIPIIGIGTNAYNLSDELRPQLRDVMSRFVELGGSVYDTATGYAGGQSESVLGQLHSELGLRKRLFLVTKIVSGADDTQGRQLFATSLERMKVDVIDGLLIHNLNGVEPMMPVLQEWKQAGKIRYLGISTSSNRQYEDLMGHMRRHRLDLVQVDYSLGNRDAEPLLALAQERGTAVMVNVPFGGRRGASENFARLASVPLPGFAAELGISSWPQFFLKYIAGHPAVTVIIPGTRRVEHLEDNLAGGRGRVPDAAARKQMEAFYDQLPS
jgi:aryl-alcohol dehydrogenase-like predicted oxidoreductase